MFKILQKDELGPQVKLFVVETPEIARKAKPGQFIILRIDEAGERIPLTIADSDPEAEWEETITKARALLAGITMVNREL